MESALIASLLQKNELVVARLYSECARLFPKFCRDFEQLATEEEFHAAVFSDIIVEIESAPGDWQVNKISSKTAELLNRHLNEALEEIAGGHVAPRYALTVLKSFEQSMTEMAAAKILVYSGQKSGINLTVIDDSFPGHYKRLIDLEKQIFGENQADQLFKF